MSDAANRSKASVVFLSGQYVPRAEAKLDIEDRSIMFADGVYEVVCFYNAIPIAMAAHQARLARSMDAVDLTANRWTDQFAHISDELIRRNNMPNAKVYWQVTRGSAVREHAFTDEPDQTVFAITYPGRTLEQAQTLGTMRLMIAEDQRWHRCDVKSLMLLPNAMARTAAQRQGADDAILHRNGRVTESTSANVFAVLDGRLCTPEADQWILRGTTRDILIRLADEMGIECDQRSLTIDELARAGEIFLTSTSTHVKAAIELAGRPIGDGGVGPVTRKLHDAFLAYVRSVCAADRRTEVRQP